MDVSFVSLEEEAVVDKKSRTLSKMFRIRKVEDLSKSTRLIENRKSLFLNFAKFGARNTWKTKKILRKLVDLSGLMLIDVSNRRFLNNFTFWS